MQNFARISTWIYLVEVRLLTRYDKITSRFENVRDTTDSQPSQKLSKQPGIRINWYSWDRYEGLKKKSHNREENYKLISPERENECGKPLLETERAESVDMKNTVIGTSLAIWWLGLCAFTAEDPVRSLVRELRSHMPHEWIVFFCPVAWESDIFSTSPLRHFSCERAQ